MLTIFFTIYYYILEFLLFSKKLLSTKNLKSYINRSFISYFCMTNFMRKKNLMNVHYFTFSFKSLNPLHWIILKIVTPNLT